MSLDDLRVQLESASSNSAKERLVQEFVRTEPSPIIKDDQATFFYAGKARQAALEGDWTNWQPTAQMTRLLNTSLWFREEHFPRAARLEYRLVLNENSRKIDPYNSHATVTEFGNHSVVIMPDYRAPREISDEGRIVPGIVKQHWLTTEEFKERRLLWVCLPPRFDPQKKYPVAYFNNGYGYLHHAALPRIMDYLIFFEIIQPFIAVLIKPGDGDKEYALNEQYVHFLTNRLVPWVDERYPTRPEPRARAIVGAGFGGLMAAHAALCHPEVFGLVGGQSGPYGYQQDALLREYADADKKDVRFHLVVGEFEKDLTGSGKPAEDYVAAQRRFVELLQSKGYAVESGEYPEGHQWGFWRAHLGDMLKSFWKS
jgi:enterochelin esterase-like enzyme